MIIQWSTGIEKPARDSGSSFSHAALYLDTTINITNPLLTSADIKELKRLYTLHPPRPDYSDLPLADHRSNGFVNNPRLLQENVFYPMNPMNCWTHDATSEVPLAYCSIVLKESDNPALYKIVKHGMKHVQEMYRVANEPPKDPVATADNRWDQDFDNEEFFDLGDLTIIACGELVDMKDITNVEVYCCKLNLQYNEEHFVRLVQAEDILFSGLEWQFFTHDVSLGPFSSLDLIRRLKREKTQTSWRSQIDLIWLDKEISSFSNVESEEHHGKALVAKQQRIDNTLKFLDSIIEIQTNFDPVHVKADQDFMLMSDGELGRSRGRENSNKSTFSAADSWPRRRLSHVDTQQTTPEKSLIYYDSFLNS